MNRLEKPLGELGNFRPFCRSTFSQIASIPQPQHRATSTRRQDTLVDKIWRECCVSFRRELLCPKCRHPPGATLSVVGFLSLTSSTCVLWNSHLQKVDLSKAVPPQADSCESSKFFWTRQLQHDTVCYLLRGKPTLTTQ